MTGQADHLNIVLLTLVPIQKVTFIIWQFTCTRQGHIERMLQSVQFWPEANSWSVFTKLRIPPFRLYFSNLLICSSVSYCYTAQLFSASLLFLKFWSLRIAPFLSSTKYQYFRFLIDVYADMTRPILCAHTILSAHSRDDFRDYETPQNRESRILVDVKPIYPTVLTHLKWPTIFFQCLWRKKTDQCLNF
jgi:hypothetical protein